MEQLHHRRYAKADEELAGYFTAAIGVHAQSYDSGGGGSIFNPNAAASARLDAMRWLAPRQEGKPRPRGTREWYDDVTVTVRQLPVQDRQVAELVYGYRTDALPEGDAVLETDENKRDEEPAKEELALDPLGLLKIAIAPTWGHGSFLRLAVLQPRVVRAFSKRSDLPPSPSTLLDFLCFEAGKGTMSEKFLAKVRDDCESERNALLKAYDPIRKARVLEANERDKAEQVRKKDQRAALLSEMLGKNRARERRRFDVRLRSTP